MEKKEYMTKVYRHFSDFVSASACRELDYYIIDSKFTGEFNRKLVATIEDTREIGRDGTAFNVVFNTDGEAVIIDAEILGRFVSNAFSIGAASCYKGMQLNKIVRSVINASDKAKKDFVIVSFAVLYNTLGYIYSEISYNKSVTEKYKEAYNMEEYSRNDLPIIVSTILIMEDICRYLQIAQEYLSNCVLNQITKKV